MKIYFLTKNRNHSVRFAFITIVITQMIMVSFPLRGEFIFLDEKDPKKVKALLDSAKSMEEIDLTKALSYYHEALRISKIHELENFIAIAYYGIVNIHYQQFNYDKTDKYADTLIQIAPTNRYKMLAIERKGDVHWYNGRFDLAGQNYLKVKQLAEEIGDSAKLATVLRDLGDYARQTGDYKSAVVYFNNSIELLKEMKDTSILPSVYNNYSIVFYSTGDYHKQLEYLLKALELKKASNDFSALALYNKNIADVYIQLKEYPTALEKIREAIAYIKKSPFLRFEIYVNETAGRSFFHLEQFDSSRYYFLKALQLSDSVGEKRYQARINRCLGDLAAQYDNYELANGYYNTSLAFYDYIEDPVYEVKTYISIAQVGLLSGKYEHVKASLMKAQTLSKKYGNKGVLTQVFRLLSQYYQKQGNISMSNTYLNKLDSLNDIVFNEDRVKYISVNEILYNTKNQELENIKLKQDIINKNAEYSKQAMRLKIGTIIIIAILLIAISLYYAYRKTRLSKLKISIQNKQLHKKNQEVEKANQQQMDLIHLVAHDLKAPLNKIQGLASIIKLDNNLSTEQKEIINKMDEVLFSSRKFIVSLLEAQHIERMSLEPKLKWYPIDRLSMEWKKELEQQVHLKSQKAVFTNYLEKGLLIQVDIELMHHVLINLFSNAVKFSPEKSTILFRLENDSKRIYLHINDEGPGFTKEDEKNIYSKFQKLSARPTNNESSTGLGLYLIKSLLTKMDGIIQLIPSEKGAHFRIEMPYKKA